MFLMARITMIRISRMVRGMDRPRISPRLAPEELAEVALKPTMAVLVDIILNPSTSPIAKEFCS